MAYFSQENKKSKSPAIKAIFKKYGIKGSLSVDNHSTFKVTIKESPIDFLTNYTQTINKQPRYDQDRQFFSDLSYLNVNSYWFNDHFSGTAKECIKEILDAMNEGNHNNSDTQTDYYDYGWYVELNIGSWNKPYFQA